MGEAVSANLTLGLAIGVLVYIYIHSEMERYSNWRDKRRKRKANK